MEQNRPTNPFTSGVSTAAPDSFQAAIDYLLKGRQQTAATQRQGLFTQPAPVATPTTSVVKDVFGDQYRRGSSDSNSGVDPVTGQPLAVGNPFSGAGLFSSRGMAPSDYMDRAANTREYAGAVSGVAGIFNPILGVLAKYGMNNYADYLDQQAKEAYQDFYDKGVYDYYSQENVNRDLTAPGIDWTPAEYDETPIEISPDEMSNTYQSSGADYISGYGDSGVSGGYGYSGEGGDYGRSGAANDRD